MSDKHYDVIVIGAGLAGLSVAGLMAKNEGKKVLVIEKEKYLGGRMLSYRGKGDKIVTHMGEELDATGFRKSLASVYSWVHTTTPDLDTIMREERLDGYGFECGGTVTFWGNYGRLAFLLKYLGIPVEMSDSKGFLVIVADGKEKYQVQVGQPYGWMSDQQNKMVKSMLKEMLIADDAKLAEWDGQSLHEWIKKRTDDETIYEYLAAVASIHMVSGEPQNIAARDFIRFMHTAGKIGVNLITGGATGVMPNTGFGSIGINLANLVRGYGGDILLDTNVTQVLFDNNKAVGVEIEEAGAKKKFSAEKIVCTLPTRDMFSIIPKEKFGSSFVQEINTEFFSTGMLTAFFGIKRNIVVDAGVEAKSWMLAPSILKAEDGFIGDVDIIITSKTNWEPTLGPVEKGYHSLGMSIALLDHEIKDKKKVQKVIDKCREIAFNAFPTMQESLIFELWLCSYRGYGDWPPAGEARPAIVQPGIEGLYLAGDGYGSNVWGAGMDAAVHSAIFCVDEMTGGSYIKNVLPEYHR